ncbi:hypothetical protein QBC37DRAFT_433406 [Rhypophila decipiens]|uniref:Uncharacterized protein n=1 Tax=Rhypophila decipiens TaxID=261697 RepID=A0AAN6XVJ0_9PEZI|nr:hypothetical protein QBC37DRAFT_433406 [Rhypophila decipiens]
MTIIEKDKEINRTKASLQAQIAELQKRIASYGESGFRFVIDDKFRDKMEVAEQMISKLVSYVTRPSFQHLALDLDPTGFLQRNQHHLGNRIWIKFIFGVCWEVLRRGFFSSPLGFGIFGAEGDGFVLLDHIHQILAVHDATTSKLEILNDKQTNEVRGFLFEQIWGDVISASTAMSPEYQSNASGNKGLSIYLDRRIDVVADELVSVLSRCSGNNLDSRAPAQVRELVRHIGLLGLEMATQRAHLTLEFRAHGEDIQQGTVFMDETVGEGASGAACVDLLTEPAVTRLGNGRNDFTEYKVLRPGTFVAMRS